MRIAVQEDWGSTNRLRWGRPGVFIGLMAVLGGMAGCRGWKPLGEGKPTFVLTSSSFRGGEIQKVSTCDGAEASPELVWDGPPAETRSFALIAVDRDSPISFVHWVLYNVPAEKRELPEGLPKQEQLPDGSRQGQNDYDKAGYVGPCAPGKSEHRYVFVLYALDSRLNLPAQATRKQVEDAINGHILAHGELAARYRR